MEDLSSVKPGEEHEEEPLEEGLGEGEDDGAGISPAICQKLLAAWAEAEEP